MDTNSFSLPATREDYTRLLADLARYNTEEQRVIMAELGKRDLFFFNVYILGRKDMDNDWHFARMREVQEKPDGMLDLWFRGSGKTSIITHGMTIWNIMQNPELTFGICSWSRKAAIDIVKAIKTELETNELLKTLYPEVLYQNPETESVRWTEEKGLVVKRKSNKRESTVEGTGLDTQATGRHWDYIVYDDIVSVNNVTSNEVISNTTSALLTSFNLVSANGKKRFIGTRYHAVDTYEYLISHGIVTTRIFPATVDGTATGEPVSILTREKLEEKRREMSPYIFSCHCAGTKVTMGDWTLKNIEDVKEGDEVIGFTIGTKDKNSELVKTKVVAVGKGIKPSVASYMEDGTICKHSVDHLWYTGRPTEKGRRLYSELGFGYHQLSKLQKVHDINFPELNDSQKVDLGYLCGMIDGEGGCEHKTLQISQDNDKHKYICERIMSCLRNVGFDFSEYRSPDRTQSIFTINGGRNARIKLLNYAKGFLAKHKQIEKQCFGTRCFSDVKLLKQESLGEQVVYRIQTETGNYLANGFASKNCQMLLNPISDSDRLFSEENFMYYDRKGIDKMVKNVYITVDAATSKKKGSDYTAMAVMAIDGLGNYYLVDLVKDKLNLEERKKKLFELVLKYRPLAVGYERYSLAADIEFINRCQQSENFRFPIVELSGKLTKYERVDAFSPVVRNKRFYMPETLRYIDYEGREHELINELRYEMTNFPKGHDDCIDAIARIVDPKLNAVQPVGINGNGGLEFAEYEFEF